MIPKPIVLLWFRSELDSHENRWWHVVKGIIKVAYLASCDLLLSCPGSEVKLCEVVHRRNSSCKPKETLLQERKLIGSRLLAMFCLLNESRLEVLHGVSIVTEESFMWEVQLGVTAWCLKPVGGSLLTLWLIILLIPFFKKTSADGHQMKNCHCLVICLVDLLNHPERPQTLLRAWSWKSMTFDSKMIVNLK